MANGHTSCYALVCGPHVGSNDKWYTLLPRLLCGPHVGSNDKWYTLLPRLLCTFIVYTEHMNVTTGCVIHPGRPHVTNGSSVLDHVPTPRTEAMNF